VSKGDGVAMLKLLLDLADIEITKPILQVAAWNMKWS
jgi:hypothetical protein